jgi:2-isopropylmalate synthase
VLEAVIAEGATIINIPDTVGYAVPEGYGNLIKTIRERVPNSDKAVWSVHCHDDLGMAVANSLAGVHIGGARQIECTINGLGERAGNAALEEVVMGLRTRADVFGCETKIDTKRILATSRLVSSLTGIQVQRNKAIVGENAFAHESGIHQDGILKERCTYEIMLPADVGVEQTRLVLGKHSGRHAFAERLKELGFDLSEAALAPAFDRFKTLCDRKKTIYDADLIALVEDQIGGVAPIWDMEVLQVSSGNRTVPTATVALKQKDKIIRDAAIGDGPIDALVRAIDRITKHPGKILDYEVHSVTEGREAQGEVDMKVDFGGTIIHGRAVSTDVVEASAKAYLNAVCRALLRAQNGK